MFQCNRCFKTLSSKQALNYHQRSNSCGTADPTAIYKRECDIGIECTADGIILDVQAKGISALTRKYYNNHIMAGTNIYDHINPDDKYALARSHIECLSHGTLQRLEIQSFTSLDGSTLSFICLLLSHKNKLFMFQYDTKYE